MISVCMPTYNGEKYIRKQIDSILMQLDPKDELIISDDSSTDHTIDIIKSYDDERIKLIPNQVFKSPVFNLENALKMTEGDYIFLADQDDIWLPNKVFVMKKYLKKHSAVVSNCQLINSNEEIVEINTFSLYKSGRGFFKNLVRNSYMGCCMAITKELKNQVLPFPSRIAMHDSWIGLNAELLGKPYFCNEVLIQYRRHENTCTSTRGQKSKLSFLYKIQYRIELFFLVVLNIIRIKMFGTTKNY